MKITKLFLAALLILPSIALAQAERVSRSASDKVEDAAETAGMYLSATGCVVRAAKTGSSATAGDNATCNVDATGGLWTAEAQIEDAAHSSADVGAMVLGVRAAAPVDRSAGGTDGDYEPLALDALGKLWTTGTYVEDAGETAGGNLVMMGSVQRTVLVPSAGTTGDNATINTSSNGALWTEEAQRAVAYGSSPAAVAAGVFGAPIADLEGRPYVNTAHPRAVSCTLTTTSTSKVQVTGCEVVASNSYYITSVWVSGDIANATATPWIVKAGTSTDCTGDAVLLRGYHPALSGSHLTFPTPIKTAAGHGLCLEDGVTGTKVITITGYIAP